MKKSASFVLRSPLPCMDGSRTQNAPALLPAAARTHWVRLYDQMKQMPLAEVPMADVEAHFQNMPARYWEAVCEADLRWALHTIHRLHHPLTETAALVRAAIDWRQGATPGVTHVMLCTWDRPGLLAKAAAAFSVLNVNIIRADIYTRHDGLAIDLFDVSGLEQPVRNEFTRLQQMLFLLEGALSDPPRFASFWAYSRHRLLPRKEAVQPTISFDAGSDEFTILEVSSADRIGLLYDILETLERCDINVVHASISTDNNTAYDVFHLTDLQGRKVQESTLDELRLRLMQAIASSEEGNFPEA